MQLFLLLAFIIAVIFVVFSFQNNDTVVLQFIQWKIEEPLAIVLAVPFAAGLLSTFFLFIPVWWKKSKQIRTQKKRIEELEAEVRELSSRPVEQETDSTPSEQQTQPDDQDKS